eukprot:SAG31_NODE_230_length_19771_cov_90.041739_9_plen_203_part_00
MPDMGVGLCEVQLHFRMDIGSFGSQTFLVRPLAASCWFNLIYVAATNNCDSGLSAAYCCFYAITFSLQRLGHRLENMRDGRRRSTKVLLVTLQRLLKRVQLDLKLAQLVRVSGHNFEWDLQPKKSDFREAKLVSTKIRVRIGTRISTVRRPCVSGLSLLLSKTLEGNFGIFFLLLSPTLGHVSDFLVSRQLGHHFFHFVAFL